MCQLILSLFYRDWSVLLLSSAENRLQTLLHGQLVTGHGQLSHLIESSLSADGLQLVVHSTIGAIGLHHVGAHIIPQIQVQQALDTADVLLRFHGEEELHTVV